MNVAGPDYSIIIPTYRRREPLARCLDAIASLAFPRDRFEVIVVDDGSPTLPTDLIAALDPAIDVRLVCAEHAGPAGARNAGARFARGRYLAFTDDDCTPASDWLTAIDRRMNAAAGPIAVGGRIVNHLTTNFFAEASQGIIDFLYEYYGARLTQGRFFTTNNLAVPRVEFNAIGGFDYGFRMAAAEDRDLSERLRAHGVRLEYADDVVVDHAHELSFARFSRQHFTYGRGAFDLHGSRARRGEPVLRVESPGFYARLVGYPLRRERTARAALLSLLHLWAQMVYGSGYVFERVRRGWVVRRDVPRRPEQTRARVVERSEMRAAAKPQVTDAV